MYRSRRQALGRPGGARPWAVPVLSASTPYSADNPPSFSDHSHTPQARAGVRWLVRGNVTLLGPGLFLAGLILVG